MPPIFDLRALRQDVGHRLPELQSVPASDRQREHHAGAAPGEARQDHRARELAAPRWSRSAFPTRSIAYPEQLLGRPAAARGDRAFACDVAQGDAVRRGDFGRSIPN